MTRGGAGLVAYGLDPTVNRRTDLPENIIFPRPTYVAGNNFIMYHSAALQSNRKFPVVKVGSKQIPVTA